MRNVMFYATLIVSTQCRVFADAESSEIFPLSGITVGMSSKELLDKYPTEDILFPKEKDGKVLEQGLVCYEISTNRFWDSMMIVIEDSRVKTFGYLYINNELLKSNSGGRNHDKIVNNIKPLFVQLKKELGTAFEKRITYGETTKTRCAMYIWKREKDVVAFTHSPISKYKKGERFDCQLTISQKIEGLGGLYGRMAIDSLPEDAKLWADAMEE